MLINDLLKLAIDKRASDLHLKIGSHPVLRVNGDLAPVVEHRRLQTEDTLNMAFGIMNSRQKQRFKETFDVDVAYSVPGLGRFRCNIFQQRGAVGLVVRVIPLNIQSMRELLLPKALTRVADEKRGLIVCTGATGSGKSTTLAAIVDYINTEKTSHIVTVEDPIEFLHRDKRSMVNQREIEVDALSFAGAIRAALRQDPDVIMVGEMRDFETIETAVTAAETGHLVLSSLHTLDATETINRIVSVSPPHQQKQVRRQLAAVLRAAISLRLIPRADGDGRVPAVEVMVSTPFIRDCIVNEEKTRLIAGAIAQGATEGMQTFDQALFDLFQQGLVTKEEAQRNCTNPDEFRMKLSGIATGTVDRDMDLMPDLE